MRFCHSLIINLEVPSLKYTTYIANIGTFVWKLLNEKS